MSTIKKVTKIETAKRSPSENRKLRVAAYARVSTDSDAQLESLETQKSHYESYIRSRDDWEETLSGRGSQAIANSLNRERIPTKRDGRWTASTIRGILENEKYTGDVIYQKTFTDSQYNRHKNRGQRNQYLETEHHEAIISHEDFEAAAAIIAQHAAEKGIQKGARKYLSRYPFSGKIICGECGNTFKRRIHTSKG